MALDGALAAGRGCMASSHFCTAERQYRTPLEYGGQRTPTAQWTVTGSGAVILDQEGPGPYITHVTPGQIVDKGHHRHQQHGVRPWLPPPTRPFPPTCGTPAAPPDFYDLIVTGDLGQLGRELLLELFQRDGIDLSDRHTDCGLLIFDRVRQDVHCGGSGCGCSASVLTGYLVEGLRSGKWRNISLLPHRRPPLPPPPPSGESVPGICHAVALSAQRPNTN